MNIIGNGKGNGCSSHDGCVTTSPNSGVQPQLCDYVHRFSWTDIWKGMYCVQSMTRGIWAGKNWKLRVTWRLGAGRWPLTHHICDSWCWVSAGTSTGAVSWASYMWPLCVVWAFSQRGSLRIIRLLTWSLRPPQVSYFANKVKVALSFSDIDLELLQNHYSYIFPHARSNAQVQIQWEES